MQKARLLLLCGALVFCACRKDPVPEPPSKDADLTGQKVDVSGFPESLTKVFLLNEGGMGSNNATLDFLRISDGNYVTGAFRKMNPDVGAGLGDVGNDISVHGDELWMVINNSGIVEVVSAKDETEIAAIAVPTPRNIAFDDTYAYVTSWAGAFVSGSYDADWNYVITDSRNPKGQVYRIDLKTKKVTGSVEVGYQPEGIALYEGKLYVANSGGIASQLPPDYQYGKTVSVIKTDTFEAYTEVEVGINPKNVIADSERIYVTTQGDFFTVHSALYFIGANANPLKADKKCECVTAISVCGQMVYGIGTEDELDWEKTSKDYYVWSYSPVPMIGYKKLSSPAVSGTALSGLCVLSVGDNYLWMVTDQGDYVNPGRLDFYWKGEKAWSTTTGICPGHFLAL